jgi:NADH:ubiquinone oxidoreductase subunit D
MYSAPHFEGDEIARMAVVGIRDSGEEIDIRPEDIGGGYWYFQVFARAVARTDDAVIRDMVRMYEIRHNVQLAALRVENRPLLWKGAQVEAAPIEILRTYPLSAAQDNSTIP